MKPSTATHLIVLDSEAVSALRGTASPQHRKVVSHLQVVAQRKRRAVGVAVVVPTTVRTEAGWDRTLPEWSLANQVGVADVALSPVLANVAATIRFSGRVPLSVTNAHIGAVVQSSDASLVTVITSDPADVRAACGNVAAVIVTL